jgi:hypothetical protein
VRTLQVGPGKQYKTIQDAVNAAAALDDPAAKEGVPPFKPITILVYEGIYYETVNVPADAAVQVTGANDYWTIRAARAADTGKAVDDVVILAGALIMNTDREFFTFDGINIMAPGDGRQDFGFRFQQTCRNDTVQNCIIWNVKDAMSGGDVRGDALYSNRAFGTNYANHVTMVGNDCGIYARDVCSWVVHNCIISNSTSEGLEAVATSGGPLDHCLVYNPPNLPPANPIVWEQPVNCESNFYYGVCSSANFTDGGSNTNWPLDAAVCGAGNTCTAGPRTGQACATSADCLGQSPQFLSTNPADLGFLRLASNSPARGTASSAGAYTGGEANIGAFATGAASPGTIGGCCLPNGTCAQYTIFGCALNGGVWKGAGVPCSSLNCSLGACCDVDSTCTETTQAACTGSDFAFQGVGTTCASASCPFVRPDPYADRDRDGDVDMDDFGAFQRCYSGSGVPYPPGCGDFDRPEAGFPNGDGDVDSQDFAAFLLCVSGPKVPANKACDDH